MLAEIIWSQSFLFDLFHGLWISKLLLLVIHKAHKTIFPHFTWRLIVVAPNVLDVLTIQTSHRFPLEHIVLCPCLELILLAVFSVKALEATFRLAEEVAERRVSRSGFKVDKFSIRKEFLQIFAINFHFIIDFLSYICFSLVYFLWNHFNLFFLFLLFLSLLSSFDKVLLFIFPVLF